MAPRTPVERRRDTRRFGGSVVWTPSWSGLPWGALEVSREECVTISALRRRRRFRRSETVEVQVRTFRLWPFMVRTTVQFLDEERTWTPLFVPHRTKRVLESLIAAGWPVHIETVGYRGWLERVTTRG